MKLHTHNTELTLRIYDRYNYLYHTKPNSTMQLSIVAHPSEYKTLSKYKISFKTTALKLFFFSILFLIYIYIFLYFTHTLQ